MLISYNNKITWLLAIPDKYSNEETVKEMLNSVGFPYKIARGSTETNDVKFFLGLTSYIGLEQIASVASRYKSRQARANK